MAKVKTSSLLAEIRGDLGGVVFSSNGAGFYCRQLVTPVQPRTPLQSSRRSTFSQLTRQWQTLSAAERAAWIAYAADPTNTRYDYFGDPYLPTGHQQYVGVNLLRVSAGQAVTATAPTGAVPPSLPNMEVYVDFQAAGGNSYVARLAAFPAGIAYVQILFRYWTSLGKLVPPNPLHLLDIPGIGSFPSYDIQTLLYDRYGDMATDGRWYVALAPLSSTFRMGAAKTYTGENQDTVTG